MRRCCCVAWMLLALLSLSACKWQPERYVEVIRYQSLSPAARLVYLGDRALAEGRAAEAILAYRNAAETDPRHVPALLRLGRAYANQGRRRLALRYLQAAQTFQPRDAEIAADLAAVQAAWPPADSTLRLLWQASAGKSMPVGMAAEGETIYVTFEEAMLTALSTAKRPDTLSDDSFHHGNLRAWRRRWIRARGRGGWRAACVGRRGWAAALDIRHRRANLCAAGHCGGYGLLRVRGWLSLCPGAGRWPPALEIQCRGHDPSPRRRSPMGSSISAQPPPASTLWTPRPARLAGRADS